MSERESVDEAVTWCELLIETDAGDFVVVCVDGVIIHFRRRDEVYPAALLHAQTTTIVAATMAHLKWESRCH